MRRLEMILSRLVWFVPTMAGLVVIVFLISNVIPTDPVKVLLGENATTAQIEAMRVKLGYDQPLWVQLARHFHDIMSGNLGISLYTQRPIAEDLWTRVPATLELTLTAITVSVTLRHSARRHSGADAQFAHRPRAAVFTVSGLAIAAFWLAIFVLQFLFAMKLGVDAAATVASTDGARLR